MFRVAVLAGSAWGYFIVNTTFAHMCAEAIVLVFATMPFTLAWLGEPSDAPSIISPALSVWEQHQMVSKVYKRRPRRAHV